MTNTNIHPTAIVSSEAELAEDVQIGAYSIVGPHVKIGKGTVVHPHVVLDGRTTLGERNEIFPFASIGTAPQDLKYRGEPSTLVIGDRNKIREFVTIQPGTEQGRMTTTVGNQNLFMANSHVGHDCEIGNGNIFANSVGLAGHVTIFDYAILGGLVGIHQFTRIGSHAFISAGSMVGLDVPPYCIAQGDRASLRGLNIIGLQRSGFTTEEIRDVKRAYRHLFASAGSLKEKIQSLPTELASTKRVRFMLDFLASSNRGITQPSRHEPGTESVS